MATRIPPSPQNLSLRFGLGVNSAGSEDRVDERECVFGRNVLLIPNNSDFKPRPPFELLGTVPNGAEIRGFVTLRQANGTVTMLVQAGANVYQWDGGVSTSPFTSVATLNAQARIRGRLSHYWPLDDLVIITDLAGLAVVKTWDGTDFVDNPEFGNETTAGFGTFRAKYCVVRDERAFYGNVADSLLALPHMIVGSALSDYLTVSNTIANPSAAEPFFLLTPDLRPINGLVEAFGLLAISSAHGSIWKLSGVDATDFSINGLFQGSAASGEESITYVGNDVAFGRPGRVESLIAVDRFGDVSTDDLTLPIANDVEDVNSWQILYNSRNQRIYCLADGGPALWVFHKPVTEGSPWMLWQTNHALAFQPTAMMTCLDPIDGLEYVFMGDDEGNLYRLEGSYDSGGDGGTHLVEAERLSKLYPGPLDTTSFNFDGWIRAKSAREVSLDATLEYVGERGFTRDRRNLQILDPFGAVSYYGGAEAAGDAAYYGGTEEDGDAAYYSELGRGPFSRHKIGFAGQGHDFQIRLRLNGDTEATLGEVGLRYTVSK